MAGLQTGMKKHERKIPTRKYTKRANPSELQLASQDASFKKFRIAGFIKQIEQIGKTSNPLAKDLLDSASGYLTAAVEEIDFQYQLKKRSILNSRKREAEAKCQKQMQNNSNENSSTEKVESITSVTPV